MERTRKAWGGRLPFPLHRARGTDGWRIESSIAPTRRTVASSNGDDACARPGLDRPRRDGARPEDEPAGDVLEGGPSLRFLPRPSTLAPSAAGRALNPTEEISMALQHLTDEQVATWSREQKDQWWLTNVYRGDMPQLTFRAALTGFLLGGHPLRHEPLCRRQDRLDPRCRDHLRHSRLRDVQGLSRASARRT